MTILLAIYTAGVVLAFPAALWLLIAAVRAGVGPLPWWGVVLAAVWVAVAWPWALFSFFC